MLVKVLSASVGLSLISVVAQQRGVEFRKNDAFHGPVKTVRMERALVAMQDGEPVEGERRLIAVKSYSPDGKRSETKSFRPDGSLRVRNIHVYDDSGNLIEEEHYDGANVLIRKLVYVLRGDELSTFGDDGKLLQREVTSWNEARTNKIEIKTFDGDGALIKRSVHTRDPNTGNSIWTSYRGDGTRTVRNEFDRSGDIKTHRANFNHSGTAVGRRDALFERMANGMKIEAAETNADGKVLRRTMETRETDARKNLVKQTYFEWDEAAEKFVPMSVDYNVITYY